MTRRPLVVEAEPAFRTAHANPYNASLYRAVGRLGVRVDDLSVRRLATRRVDVVHLHWPDLTFLSSHRPLTVLLRLATFFGALRLARLRGTRLVWTAHNLASHEQRSTPALRALFRRLLLANLDGVLTLTADGAAAVRDLDPALADLPTFVTPHGHYRDDYDFTITRAQARERLAISPHVRLVVTVGQIRPYKNVPRLIEVFAQVPDPQARLAVVGKPSGGVDADGLRALAEADERVIAELEFLPADRLALWLRAADLVVLPYRRIQNSGSALLALSADRPVLVPAIGAMTELAETVGPGWVRCYDGDLDAATLGDALAWAAAPRPEVCDLDGLGWDRIAVATVEAYESVLAAPRRRRGSSAARTRTPARGASDAVGNRARA
ncbi:glycosyltransferase [Xylanimonas ulmi]|uniref:Glycosyltransferase involved in cell wall biosynthesis n=1 Tax=Xylanimonas ulmi TaxID=228973 RepID=A0A4Q7M5C1_9MICO|nr:glycosyltransferase [Xylanibacterium ulmi]RZS62621.1 glycosyltransferase involved in cell wall biosynthesis [Xylanibacterium ulmi]